MTKPFDTKTKQVLEDIGEEKELGKLVLKFNEAMIQRLIEKMDEGFTGWKTMQPWQFKYMIQKNILSCGKLDMVDVANLAMFIYRIRDMDETMKASQQAKQMEEE